MSNFKTAISAIEAEISYAKQGVDYYTLRVKSLKQALAELKQAGEVPVASTNVPMAPKGPVKTIAKASKLAKKRTGKRAVKAAPAADLPPTGGDFWPNIVSDQPQHSSAILQGAIDSLGFTPTPLQVKQLQSRMVVALNALVRQKKIQDSGKGRDRKFFKK